MMQVLVVGAGNFGATVAQELGRKGCEVIVIDNDPQHADDIKDHVAQVIIGDATDKDLLLKFAKNVELAIVSLGEKVDASVLITHSLKEMGLRRIIAKATSVDHGKILKIIGATQVVFPERDEAVRLVTSLVTSNVLDFVKLSEEYNLVELAVPTEFLKKTIGELDLRRKYGFHIIALKNALDGTMKLLPDPEYAFRPDDIMVVIGDEAALDEIRKRNQE